MLVFAPGGDDAYPDDTDRERRWRPPVGLEPLAGPDGMPQVLVGRSDDGGLLHLRLAAKWPEPMASGDRPLPIASGRFRLLLQGPAARETGQWWPTPIDGAAIVERSVSLAPAEAAIARHLGERGEEVVEVEVELGVDGLAPAFPWLASVPTQTLRERVAALLGAQPATWDVVEAAFLGLSEDTFAWFPLAPGALRPPLDEALRAIAYHSAPLLFTMAADTWTLVGGGGPERIDIDLRVPRRQRRRIGLRWSLSAFLDAQPDRARHLVDLAAPAPFEAAPLGVVNDLPLAEGGLRELVVEVRTGGPTGMLSHIFRPGEPGVAQWRFVRPTFAALDLQWRVRYTVSTAEGPMVGTTDFRAGTQLIELNAAALGLKVLPITAEGDVFTQLASLEVKVGARTFVLTRAAPRAWAVGRQPPANASATAVLASGERIALGEFTLGAMGLAFDSAALGVGEPLAVSLRAPADLPQRAAYLGLQVEGCAWRSVDAGVAVGLVLTRPNRWRAPPLRYRTRHVPRAADGVTGAIVESAWREASGEQLEIVW